MQWHYTNLTLLLVSFLAAYVFAETYMFQALLHNLQTVGYFGIFLVGIFFTSIFTVAPAGVILVGLGQRYDALTIALIAGAGAVIGDYLIFRFIQDAILEELRSLIGKRRLVHFLHPFRSKHFVWLLPLIGAMIIASPLPDEPGVAMLGVTKIKTWHFVLITFFLNIVGIYLLVQATT